MNRFLINGKVLLKDLMIHLEHNDLRDKLGINAININREEVAELELHKTIINSKGRTVTIETIFKGLEPDDMIVIDEKNNMIVNVEMEGNNV